MDKNDLFMHSELHGAAVCIVKNPSGLPVPAISLMEAATFEMCHSPCIGVSLLGSCLTGQQNASNRNVYFNRQFYHKRQTQFYNSPKTRVRFYCHVLLTRRKFSRTLRREKAKGFRRDQLGRRATGVRQVDVECK